MGSIGTGEIIVIVLVVLIVFGPERLPEISRKAGQFLARARQMSRSMTGSLDGEYDEVIAPIRDLKKEYDSTVTELKNAAASVGDVSIDIPKIEIDPAKADAKPHAGRGTEPTSPAAPQDPDPSVDEAPGDGEHGTPSGEEAP